MIAAGCSVNISVCLRLAVLASALIATSVKCAGNDAQRNMSTYKVTTLPSPRSQIGEGPHWDVATQSLYYIDIYGAAAGVGSIHRYDAATNVTHTATIAGEPVVSFIIPVEGAAGQFAVGLGRRVGIVAWDGEAAEAQLLRIAVEVEPEARYATNRWNDAKADPRGRLYGGTMRLEECGDIFEAAEGSVYRVAADQPIAKLKTDVGVSNGLTWDAARGRFYFIDTCTSDVKVFDYVAETGEITNERVLIDFRGADGARPAFGPDGMTIDAEGFLYVATWGGSRVLRIDPEAGRIVAEIELPAGQITSAAFGGRDLDVLYVTSAAQERDGPQAPAAGRLFAVTGLGVRGLPMSKVRL